MNQLCQCIKSGFRYQVIVFVQQTTVVLKCKFTVSDIRSIMCFATKRMIYTIKIRLNELKTHKKQQRSVSNSRSRLDCHPSEAGTAVCLFRIQCACPNGVSFYRNHRSPKSPKSPPKSPKSIPKSPKSPKSPTEIIEITHRNHFCSDFGDFGDFGGDFSGDFHSLVYVCVCMCVCVFASIWLSVCLSVLNDHKVCKEVLSMEMTSQHSKTL